MSNFDIDHCIYVNGRNNDSLGTVIIVPERLSHPAITALEFARSYLRRGWRILPTATPVVPVNLTEASWLRITRPPQPHVDATTIASPSDAETWWHEHPSSELAIVLDDQLPFAAVVTPEAMPRIREELGRGPDISSTSGEAYFFIENDEVKQLEGHDLEGVEIRRSGDIVPAPPSHNTLGCELRWVTRGNER